MRSSKIECLPLDVAQNHNFFRCPVWLVNLSFLREHSQGKASQETRSHLSYLYVYNAYIIYIDVYILSLLPWSWCILIFISWRFSSSFSPQKKNVAFPLALGGLEIFGSAWAIQLLVCQGMCWWENVWETVFYPLNIRVSRYKQFIFEYKFVKKCGITATIVTQWWSLQ